MLREPAAADLAGERPLAAVHLGVNLQVAGGLEALPAHAAAVGSVHGVVLLVQAQLRDGAEPLAADGAGAGDAHRMRLQVFAKGVHTCDGFAARHAGQRALV